MSHRIALEERLALEPLTVPQAQGEKTQDSDKHKNSTFYIDSES